MGTVLGKVELEAVYVLLEVVPDWVDAGAGGNE